MDKIIICGIGLILVLIIILAFLVKMIINLKKENKQLRSSNDSFKNTINFYKDYIENLKKIDEEKENAIEKIREAKTDEEIFDIINSTAILANNERVRNNKENDKPAAKTTKKRTSGNKKS